MTGGHQLPNGAALRRGLGVGAAYGAAYLACELVGALAVLVAAGTQSVLNLVAVELVRLAGGYLAFGAAWGLVTALPAAWLRRRVPSRMAWGPLTDGFILACVYVAIAL